MTCAGKIIANPRIKNKGRRENENENENENAPRILLLRYFAEAIEITYGIAYLAYLIASEKKAESVRNSEPGTWIREQATAGISSTALSSAYFTTHLRLLA